MKYAVDKGAGKQTTAVLTVCMILSLSLSAVSKRSQIYGAWWNCIKLYKIVLNILKADRGLNTVLLSDNV